MRDGSGRIPDTAAPLAPDQRPLWSAPTPGADTTGMSYPLFTPGRTESRYALLGAMCEEILDACRDRGRSCNPNSEIGDQPAIFLWGNFLPENSGLVDSLLAPGMPIALMQFFVDHPLVLNAAQLDRLAACDRFRMALPCLDGAHLLRLRWPTLKHFHMLHGVPRSALRDAADLERDHADRPHDLVVLGSIHSQAELDAMRAKLPVRLHSACDEIVEILSRYPWTSFEQALDITVGADGVIPGHWPLASAVFQVVSATMNRRRRVALVRAMQGVNTVVFGGVAWEEFCTGSIRFAGDVPYDRVAETMATARVCLAWGPTQFTHSFSERILLSMAAGCATVADDRLMVRRHFFTDESTRACAATYDASDPESARCEVERLIAAPASAIEIARRGRAEIERAHLWDHRVGAMLDIADGVIESSATVASAG